MPGKDLITIPNLVWGAVFAATLAALPHFSAPGWVWFLGLLTLTLWLLAIIALADPGWRGKTLSAFGDPDFKHVYRWVTIPLFARLWHRLCAPAPANSSAAATLRAALTAKVLERAMLIAVAYPILLPTLIWMVTGQAAQLGSAEFLPNRDFWDVWPERAAVLGMFVILAVALAAQRKAAPSRKPFFLRPDTWLTILASASAIGFIVAIIDDGKFAVFGASIIGIAWLYAYAFRFAGVVAITVAVGGTCGGVFLVPAAGEAADTLIGLGEALSVVATTLIAASLWKTGREGWSVVLATVCVAVTLAGSTFVADWSKVNEDRRTVFLFLGLFPIVNALFDALSYGITLSLMRLGLRGWQPLLAALCDVICALILFLGVGVALTAAAAGLNALANTPIVDIGAMLARVIDSPQQNLWVFLMLFSTALPTLIHFILAMLGAQALVPGPLRRAAFTLITAPPDAPFAPIFAPALTGVVLALPFALAGGLAWLVWVFAKGAILAGLGVYAQTLLWIATRMGAF